METFNYPRISSIIAPYHKKVNKFFSKIVERIDVNQSTHCVCEKLFLFVLIYKEWNNNHKKNKSQEKYFAIDAFHTIIIINKFIF